MSDALFLDTSGWLAAVGTREAYHEAARAAYVDQIQRGGRILTTALVVAELQVLLLRFRGPAFALELLDRLMADPSHEVVDVERELWVAAAERWLRPFGDHPFSLTDAVSFEVMRRRKVRRALALDRHFALAGYETVPTPLPRSPQRRN